MTDIRHHLNQRLRDLRETIPQSQAWVDKSADPGSVRYDKAARAIDELHQIESILAQMQLADTQRETAAAQREVAKAQHEVADAQRAATAASDAERAWSEGRAFWLRRLITSLAVAFGAASFAAVSALLRPDPPAASPSELNAILVLFLGGTLVTGGLLPLLLLWKPKAQPDDLLSGRVQAGVWTLAVLSAVALLAGVALVTRVGLTTFNKRTAEAVARSKIQAQPPVALTSPQAAPLKKKT